MKITRKQVLASTDNEILLLFLAQNNTEGFNYLKALEESTEFNEVLLKLQTKHDKHPHRPESSELINEFADFIFRGTAALLTYFPELTKEEIDDKIAEHIDEKCNKLREYLGKNKYNSKL